MIEYFKFFIEFGGSLVGAAVGVLTAIATLAGAAKYIYSKFKKLTGEKIDLEKRISSLEGSLKIQIEENINLKNALAKESTDLKTLEALLPFDEQALHSVYHMLDACAAFVGRGKVKHVSAHIVDQSQANLDTVRFLRDTSFLIARRKLIFGEGYACARSVVASDVLLSLLDTINAKLDYNSPPSAAIKNKLSRIVFDLREAEYLYKELKRFKNYHATDNLLAALILENAYFKDDKDLVIYEYTNSWLLKEINELTDRLYQNKKWYLFLPNTIFAVGISNGVCNAFIDKFDFSAECQAIIDQNSGWSSLPRVLQWTLRDSIPENREIFSISFKKNFRFKIDGMRAWKPN